jgi:hypothetical protein
MEAHHTHKRSPAPRKAVKPICPLETACAGREPHGFFVNDRWSIDARNALSIAAWDVCMEGVDAFHTTPKKDLQDVQNPHAKGGLSAQLWAAGFHLTIAEAQGAQAARTGNNANPYVGDGTKNGVAVSVFSGLKVQRAYLAKFWQDGHDLQTAESAALNANANEVQP